MVDVFLVLVLLSAFQAAEATESTNEQLAEIIDIQTKLLAEYDEKLKSVESNFRATIDNQDTKIDRLQQELEETKSYCRKLSQKTPEYETHTEHIFKEMNNVVQKRLLAPIATTQVPGRPSIAFSAHLSQIEKSLTNRHTLIFDVIQTNVGGGYNKANGFFVAPESGVYVLTWTLHHYHGGSICTVLDINGVVSGRGYAFSDSGTSHSTSTSVVVVHMNKGDVAFIRTNEAGCTNSGWVMSDNERWSSFSGWLLF